MTENESILRIHFVENYKDAYFSTFNEEPDEENEIGYLSFEPISNNSVTLSFICDVNGLNLKNNRLSEQLLEKLNAGYELISSFKMRKKVNVRYPPKLTPEQERGLDYLKAELIMKYHMKIDSK